MDGYGLRRLALSVTLGFGVLNAALPGVAEETGVRAATAGLAQAVSGERAALAKGEARILEIGQAMRPLSREDGEAPVTVTSRSAGADVVDVEKTEPLTVSALNGMSAVKGDEQWQCLATAIYFESRGEPLSGQIAVAEVILNRVDSRQYPNTVCAVTNQGAGSGRACQFSYACDGRADVMKSPGPRQQSEKLAAIMLDGRAREITDGATHFHARYVRPGWSNRLTRTASIGQHIFYRLPTRTASN